MSGGAPGLRGDAKLALPVSPCLTLPAQGCERITIEHLDWRTTEALAAVCVACVGLALTGATALVFVRRSPCTKVSRVAMRSRDKPRPPPW